MKKCVSCGLDIEDGVKFCMHCGALQPAGAPAASEFPAFETPSEAAGTEAPAAEPVVQPSPEHKETVFTAPAAPRTETVHFSAPAQQPSQPQRPAFTPTPVPAVDPEKPGAKSRWALMSTWGTVGAILLMSIPVVGFILTIIWACGGCRKYAKRNLARAELIFIVAGVILTIAGALVLRFAFPEYIVGLYEITHPGYTIVF